MRIFITGHEGQLGTVLRGVLSEKPDGAAVEGASFPAWDMTDPQQVRDVLHGFRPDVVIHTAALTNVDYCAQNPLEAIQVNGVGTYHVALTCQELDAMLVAISTNEVFDGRANRPYQEYDQRNPVNPYGYSKYVGEQVVERYASRYMIVRTAWLYAPGGMNFIHKITARARSGEPLRVVTDEVGSPTYAPDLAEALVKLVQTDRPGIYHLVNEGACSRYEFAQAILRQAGLGAEIEAITSAEFSRPSTPPPYAPLDNIFAAAAGVTMRPWQEALAAFMLQNPQEAEA